MDIAHIGVKGPSVSKCKSRFYVLWTKASKFQIQNSKVPRKIKEIQTGIIVQLLHQRNDSPSLIHHYQVSDYINHIINSEM